jgi:hypothetical protein
MSLQGVMMNKRDLLRQRLDELCEGVENRREIERLVFDLWQAQQEAHRSREQDRLNYEKDREQLPQMKRDLEAARQRIEQLEQQIGSKEFKIASMKVDQAEVERRLSNFANPVINLDSMEVDRIFSLIANAKDPKLVRENLKSLVRDMRKTFRTISLIAKNQKMFDLVCNMTDDQITTLVHIGFSELHFLRALTGDHTCTAISFIVNGERIDPDFEAIKQAKEMGRESKRFLGESK